MSLWQEAGADKKSRRRWLQHILMSDVANTTRVFFALWRSQVGDKKQPRRWLRNISIKEVADTQRMFFSEWREVIAKLRMLQDLSARDMVRTTQVVSGDSQ